jgi:hypothetical protein
VLVQVCVRAACEVVCFEVVGAAAGADSSSGIAVEDDVVEDFVLDFGLLDVDGGMLGGAGAPSVESGTIDVAGTSSSAIPAANARGVQAIAIAAPSINATTLIRRATALASPLEPRALF